MLSRTVRCLILKDVSGFKTKLPYYFAAGVLSIGIFGLEGFNYMLIASILFITTFIAFYIHLIMSTVAVERKEKNTLFIMTLPLTVKDYILSKIISCSVIFLVFWLAMLGVFWIAMQIFGHLPGVMMCYWSGIFGIFLPCFIFVLSAAIIGESEAWTIIAMVSSNIFLTTFVNIAPNLDQLQQAFQLGDYAQTGFIWIPLINHILITEFFVSAIFLCGLFIAAQRKTQFIRA